MANLLDQSQTRGGETTINIDNDIGPSTSQQRHYQPLHLTIRRESNPTARINMESNIESPGTSSGLGEGGEAFVGSNNSGDGTNQNIDEMQPLRNLFSMLRDARQQFHRQQSAVSSRDHRPSAGNDMAPVNENIPSGSGAQSRSWRENLYEVFSSPVTPRTDVLRAIFTPSPSGNFRYNSLPTNDTQAPEDHIHLLLNSNSLDQDVQTNNQLHRNSQTDVGGVDASQSTNNPGLRLYRQNSRLSERSVSGADSASSPGSSSPAATTDVDAGSRRQSNGGGITPSATNGSHLPPQRQVSVAGSTAAPTIEMDDPDTNAMGEIFVKIVSHFVRYLPFICILLVKFIHDHLLGILDLIILQGVMYQVNKSLKEQVAKLNQKSFGVLVRDTAMVICIVSYRFVMANSMPDPFGLLINPPGEKLILDLSFSSSSHEKTDQNAEATLNPLHALNQIISKHDAGELPSEPTSNPLNNDTLSLAKSASLGVLLYYIAVNDLIIKLLTQLVKIIVTMLPTKVIRPKSRVCIELYT